MNDRQQAWTGMRIRHYRLAQAFTQKALAEEVERRSAGELTVDQSSISNWERGSVEVSLRYRRALAIALDVPMDILFEAPPEGWREPAEAAA